MDEINKQVVTEQDELGNNKTYVVTTKTKGFWDDFLVSKTNQIILSLISIIDLLIFIRFMLLLLGANRVAIVNFIISLTEIFVFPFKGIFPSAAIETGYFEVASIIAIVMWLVFGFILITLISLFSRKTDETV